ncbi:MAG: hypothetical protein GY856_09755 [bacterium]|nr:hypothetical protein [bacterium]
MPVIEPNLVAKDEHFLYTFLATVWKELDGLRDPDQTGDAMSPVERTFQEVGDYLHVVDDSATPESDALGMSLQRFDRHRSGPLLEEKIRELITKFGNRLSEGDKKTLILLPVDDADISFQRLLTILDTYRRYLQHQQLVPVFTFTSVMAEELLRVHFATELLVREGQKIEESSEGPEGLVETYTSARMARRLASQMLARLFPSRTRIRLRLGAARVTKAEYYISAKEAKDPHAKKKVRELLEDASRVLYGHPEEPLGDPIRRVLLPSTLRRQLQVVDVLAHIRKTTTQRPISAWADLFDSSAWAVYDIHRDVLSQLRLHVEDLYGWTRKGLRPLVLEALLALPQAARDQLLRHWVLGSRDRRSQLLSLLGAHCARPPVEGAEDFETTGFEMEEAATAGTHCEKTGLAVDSALIWFLNVWFGFYLPQILVSKKPAAVGTKRGKTEETGFGSLQAAGWDLKSGAIHAMQEVVAQEDRWTAGTLMLFGDGAGDSVSNGLNTWKKVTTGHPQGRLLVALWCNWGIRDGKPWAAVSLWRVLALIGRVLFACRRLRDSDDGEKRLKDEDFVAEADRVEKLLKKHWETAVVSDLMGTGLTCPLDQDCVFPEWRFKKTYDKILKELAQSLVTWRLEFASDLIRIELPTRSQEHHADDPKELVEPWEGCFMRRLHGQYLMGDFWRKLTLQHIERPDKQWDASKTIGCWVNTLLEYWGPTEINVLLRTCPLLDPFVDQPEDDQIKARLKRVSTLHQECEQSAVKKLYADKEWIHKFDWKNASKRFEQWRPEPTAG